MPLPLTFNTPGRWGVNSQEQNQLLHPNWATTADGLSINDAGQLQCRGAFDLVSTDGAPAAILRQFIYVNSAGGEIVISTTATKIISGIGDLDDAATDITPTGAPTNGYWQFQNFNGKVVGWQASHTPIVWSGSGDFANIVAATGTLPDGDCVLAAFGRLWAVDDDGQTVRYCALLDETKWAAADGGGAIDMRNVWPKGMDRVTAIAAFGASLIIFGRRCIVVYTDGSGSALGVDPAQMYVVDTIDGTGCVARDTVCSVAEGDLVFLSEIGLQSFSRAILSKDNPLDTISWQIADHLSTFMVAAGLASATDLRSFTGSYIPKTRQYMLVGAFLCAFHMGGITQDEKNRTLVPVTVWSTGVLTNLWGFITSRAGVTYTAGSATHEIYKYDTTLSLDEGDVAIAVQYRSGWLKFDDPQFDSALKLLKMVQITLLNPAGIDGATSLRYATDYSTETSTLTPVYSYDDDRIIILYDPSGDIEGQYFKLGLVDLSFGRKVLTQVMAQFKIGRTAFIHKKFNDVANEAYVAPGAPVITLLSPAGAEEDSGALTLTIAGTGFTPDSVVSWDGEARATAFVSSTSLTIGLLAGDVDDSGEFDVVVTNVIGGDSNTETFTVEAAPVITSLSPSQIEEDGGAMTLTVLGTGFTTDSVVKWEGASRTTTFISSTELEAALLSTDVDDVGLFDVTVVNLFGGTSNTEEFEVTVTLTFAIWDSATHSAAIVLSGGDLTATRQTNNSGVFSSVLANIGKSAGKWYWEVRVVSPSNHLQHMLGLSKTGLSQANFPGSSSTSYGYQSQSAPSILGIMWTNNGIDNSYNSRYDDLIPVWLQVALDMDNGKLWFGTNGNYNSPVSGDPATGANPTFSGLSGTYFPAIGLFYDSGTFPTPGVMTANFGDSAFQFTVPSGFNAGIYA